MWSQSGSRFSFYEKEKDMKLLPPGVYTLEYGPFNSMYLSLKQNSFEFPYKLYGNTTFPERVVKVFNNTKANLGVMLCGLKGTGKTVEAELICNLSKLPVILVSKDYNKGADLIYFLSLIDQEVVVLIDEYEKIFGKSDILLSIMDGVLNGTHRRLFVLTANTPHISDAMIDRPSRIHYMKRFSNLSIPVIQEVVTDMLEFPEFKSDVVQYLSMLEIITIDIVKTVVREVNMFGEPPQKFKDILNVTVYNKLRWDVYNEENERLLEYVTCDLVDPFSRDYKGYDLRFREFGDKVTDYGYIKSINKKTGKITTEDGKAYFVRKSKGFVDKFGKSEKALAAAAAAFPDTEAISSDDEDED